jgi:hypothetical protein
MYSGNRIKQALPLFLTGGIALGLYGCGSDQLKTAAVGSRHNSKSAPPKQAIRLPLNPKNVLVDSYAQGKRTVTFKTTPPLLSLEVVELCENNTLVETTQRVSSTAPDKFITNTLVHLQDRSDECRGDQVAISSLDKIPQPLSFKSGQASSQTQTGQIA